MAEKRYSLTEVGDFVKEFISVLDDIYLRESVRFNWRDVMLNKSFIGSKEELKVTTQGLLYKYHKRFIAFGIATRLYPVLIQSLSKFNLEKQKAKTQIEFYDKDLANKLNEMNANPVQEFEWLSQILEMLNRNPSVGVAYITTPANHQEILNKLEGFHDKKTARELRRLIALITGSEINELIKCENDIDRWNDYVLKLGIPVLSQRIDLYLKGSKNITDNISGQIYLGLASHFKDVDLARQMMHLHEVRNIWTCQKQLTLFNDIKYYVLEALKQPLEFYRRGKYEFRVNRNNSVDYRTADSKERWKYTTAFNADNIKSKANEFDRIEVPDDSEEWSLFLGTEKSNYKNGFIHNLRKGKKYIEMVRNEFGNATFADFLEATEQKYHQSPADWYRELIKFEPEFKNLISRDLEPAKQALITIFSEKIKKLQETRSSGVVELQKMLDGRVKELQNAKLTTKRKFVKMLKIHRRKLLKQWENEKKEYEYREEGALLSLVDFAKRCENVLNRIDRRKRYVKYKKVLDYSLKGDLYLSRLFEKTIKNENKELLLEKLEGPLYYMLHKRHELAKAEENLYEEIETIGESDMQELKNLITVGRKIILPRLDRLLNYINDKVYQYFLPETIEVLERYNTEAEQMQKAA